MTQLITDLMMEFSMTNLGPMQKYLGVEFTRTAYGLLLHQTLFISEILHEFTHLDWRPSHIPLNEGLCMHRDTSTTLVDAATY